MLNLQKFAAQQLTKKEMTKIQGGSLTNGGKIIECEFRGKDGITRKVYGTGDTAAEMIADLWVGVPDYVIILENCTMG